MSKISLFLVAALVPLAVACNPITKQAKMDLAKPVDCSTAQADLRTLEHEKASVAEQFANGVMAVTPAGAAIGILTMTEDEKLEVAIGDYNHRINRKIEEIKHTCGIR